MPFRRPALVAKAAESLQRLSRGRLILGLGAGYRDAEIRAAGGPDLTPRAKVDGLEDAIAIIRAAWAAPVARYHGRVYSADDLDLEPKPARPIPIWLGALGPDRLVAPIAPATGEAADLLTLIRMLDLDDYVTLIEHLRAEDRDDPTLFDRRWPVQHLRGILRR